MLCTKLNWDEFWNSFEHETLNIPAISNDDYNIFDWNVDVILRDVQLHEVTFIWIWLHHENSKVDLFWLDEHSKFCLQFPIRIYSKVWTSGFGKKTIEIVKMTIETVYFVGYSFASLAIQRTNPFIIFTIKNVTRQRFTSELAELQSVIFRFSISSSI